MSDFKVQDASGDEDFLIGDATLQGLKMFSPPSVVGNGTQELGAEFTLQTSAKKPFTTKALLPDESHAAYTEG